MEAPSNRKEPAMNANRSAFNQRIADRRTAAGMTHIDVVIASRQMFPESLWISQSTLSRLENSTSEEAVDPTTIQVLAAIYRCTVSDLSPLAQTTLDMLTEQLLRASPCKYDREAQHAGR
jgi:transcriptional regulator with XRE-family HTH domain